MRGERGNEEERDFTHRLVTTGQLVTIEFLAESNFCVTTPLSFVSRFIPMEETTLLITPRPQACSRDRAAERDVSSKRQTTEVEGTESPGK